jgi:hypothetical protein
MNVVSYHIYAFHSYMLLYGGLRKYPAGRVRRTESISNYLKEEKRMYGYGKDVRDVQQGMYGNKKRTCKPRVLSL